MHAYRQWRSIAALACVAAFALSACTSATTPRGGGLSLAKEAVLEKSGRKSPYDRLIARYAAANGVPLSLAHAVVEKESGYNASAKGRGTVGLMQIKPATARGIGYRGSTAGLYDPATNLRWGMKYLGGAHRLGGGDICGTTLRYQGGHRATRQTALTRRYCADIKAIMKRNAA